MLTCSVTVDKSEGCMRWTFSAAFDADLKRCLTSSSANGVDAYYIRYIGPLCSNIEGWFEFSTLRVTCVIGQKHPGNQSLVLF